MCMCVLSYKVTELLIFLYSIELVKLVMHDVYCTLLE